MATLPPPVYRPEPRESSSVSDVGLVTVTVHVPFAAVLPSMVIAIGEVLNASVTLVSTSANQFAAYEIEARTATSATHAISLDRGIRVGCASPESTGPASIGRR